MFLCCTDSNPNWTVSDWSGIANIIIAAVNISLVFYIFVYQRNRDNSSKIDAAQLHEQNIHLQWFKDLIIQPHLKDINQFYTELHSLEGKINGIASSLHYYTGSSISLSEHDKLALSQFIKAEQSKIRKIFIDVLLGVNKPLYQSVLFNIDNLIDSLTTVIFTDNINLFDSYIYTKEISDRITYSRNDLVNHIFNYKGV